MGRRFTRVALLIGGTIAMTQAQMEARPEATMLGGVAAQAQATTGGGADAIRPFRVNFPDEALADMKRRITATRWPEKETVADRIPGRATRETSRSSSSYWGTGYDWRKAEAKLNALPQFMTTIDGLDIHFIHVRSKPSQRAAVDHHARVAGLRLRADQAHRSAHRSDGIRRPGRGCVRRRDSVAAGVRLLGATDARRAGGWSASAARGAPS